jgi:hypothetical protein
MVRHLTATQFAADDAALPIVDDRRLGPVVPAAVTEVLEVAESWLEWDGRPVCRDGNAWTPHKALRRVADHMLDHLTEIECRLAGQPSPPDLWHGRKITTDADFRSVHRGRSRRSHQPADPASPPATTLC